MNLLAKIDIGNSFLGTSPLSNPKGIGSLLTVFIQVIFSFAGIAILIFFILGGISLIAGAGSSDPQKIEKGKQTITSALIGFIIVFAAYWIVQLIEGWTGIKILGF